MFAFVVVLAAGLTSVEQDMEEKAPGLMKKQDENLLVWDEAGAGIIERLHAGYNGEWIVGNGTLKVSMRHLPGY